MADAAGHYRYAFPKEHGGRDGTNLGMAVIREHIARNGLGLHNDLRNESSIVGNDVGLGVVQLLFNENRIRQAASSREVRLAA